jgi:hypothetical protein
MELDLRFIGGTKGPVNFCWVMKGCNFACWGDHRSSGLILSSPRTKSIKATRLFISKSLVSNGIQSTEKLLTTIDFALLHILSWHSV